MYSLYSLFYNNTIVSTTLPMVSVIFILSAHKEVCASFYFLNVHEQDLN